MSSASFKVCTVNSVNVIELYLQDGIDSTEFDRLNEQLSTLFAGTSAKRWVLDLAGMDYLGSAALGLVVNIRQHVKSAQGKLALCRLSPALLKIFKTCCLERLFTIARTRDEALRAVK